jgi:predicted NUDIX family phosphoesterase
VGSPGGKRIFGKIDFRRKPAVVGNGAWLFGGRFYRSGMSKYAGEEVLVVPRSVLEEIGTFQGFQSEGLDSAVSRLLDPASHFFMDRGAAEDDPSHKQLIPYCVFRHEGRILHYTRGKAGGEARLHAKISVGVGGHVNPVDTGGGRIGPDAYHAAVSREIEEELELAGGYRSRIIGLLNDDSNPVGQVHLGIVHLVDLVDDRVSSREDALLDLAFSPLDVLAGPEFERLETWSQLCVRHLVDLCRVPDEIGA